MSSERKERGGNAEFRVAVIGATGYIGAPYRQEIRECAGEARIIALCARRRERLEAAAREDGAELATTDWRRAIEHPAVNLVLVSTPDALHHEAVLACAERGLHVLCEKPVAARAAEARAMWKAYQGRGLGHFVPFWTRYFPLFRRAREVVAEGRLGEVRAFVYRWHNPRPPGAPLTWRDDSSLSSAGSIGDVGSHVYDMLRWIIGEEARRVLAHAGVITPAKPDVGPIDLAEALAWTDTESADPTGPSPPRRRGATFDYGSIAVELPSGVVGTIILSHAPYLRKGLAPELELHGSEASLSVDRPSGTLRLARGSGQEEPETLATLPEGDPVNRFHEHVFPALRERIASGTSEHPGLDDGYRVQLFTDAAARSAERGEWVELSEIEEEGRTP